jgi:hypothetical protein
MVAGPLFIKGDCMNTCSPGSAIMQLQEVPGRMVRNPEIIHSDG